MKPFSWRMLHVEWPALLVLLLPPEGRLVVEIIHDTFPTEHIACTVTGVSSTTSTRGQVGGDKHQWNFFSQSNLSSMTATRGRGGLVVDIINEISSTEYVACTMTSISSTTATRGQVGGDNHQWNFFHRACLVLWLPPEGGFLVEIINEISSTEYVACTMMSISSTNATRGQVCGGNHRWDLFYRKCFSVISCTITVRWRCFFGLFYNMFIQQEQI